MEKTYVITIARQFGSLGRSISKEMALRLGIPFYDRDLVEATARRMGQPVSLISEEEESAKSRFFGRQYPLGMGLLSMQQEIYQVQKNIILDLAKKEPCIVVGRCANSILRTHPNSLHVYIYAPYEKRLENCIKELHMESKVAQRYIRNVDRARENYHKKFGGQCDGSLDGYDLLIDSSKYGVEGTAEILCEIVEGKMKK